MTGYGEAEDAVGHGRVRVEIRTVNHRHLNTSIRTPPGLDRWEGSIQEWLRSHFSRGHVNFALTVEPADADEGRAPLPELDLELARGYAELLGRLRDELGLEGPVELSHVVRFGEVFRPPEPGELAATLDEVEVRAVVDAAARGVVAMREAEGQRLRDDLEGRLRALEVALDAVAGRAPERLAHERDRLREAIRELTDDETVDEDRLAREIAYLAERWDVNEEVVRFRSHVDLFRETLGADGDEPVGKRLSFLVQEMHREANTIGAKANDAPIAHAAVSMKEEIERLREQVENVE